MGQLSTVPTDLKIGCTDRTCNPDQRCLKHRHVAFERAQNKF